MFAVSRAVKAPKGRSSKRPDTDTGPEGSEANTNAPSPHCLGVDRVGRGAVGGDPGRRGVHVRVHPILDVPGIDQPTGGRGLTEAVAVNGERGDAGDDPRVAEWRRSVATAARVPVVDDL